MPVPVEVRRSTRRRRTVSARRENGRIIVAIPAHLSVTDEQEWVARMVARLERRPGGRGGDADLTQRAVRLGQTYLGGSAVPTSVTWVANQTRRWASCTPSTGSIRVSERLRSAPAWVLDYVLVHELAHLLEGGHSPRFWALVAEYPRTEAARAFLDGAAWAAGVGLGDEPEADEVPPASL